MDSASSFSSSSTQSQAANAAAANAGAAALQLWREAAKRGHPGAQLAVATQLSSSAFLGHVLGSNASSSSVSRREASGSSDEGDIAAAGKGLSKDANQGEVSTVLYSTLE